nr:DeoR/GlpR family DNA-binding transcription regulator [uncultured Caproiciproducens sp.]
MLTEERYAAILKLVEKKKVVTVSELTEAFNSSESTIRRDLTALNNIGKLNKVHGGATAIDVFYSTKDDDVSIRQSRNTDQKNAVGRYAASLIEENDFVYIDSGTTTEKMIDYITMKNAVYVTNGTVHAKKLAQKGCHVYILGGELKMATDAVVGNEAIESLKKYNFTKGFFGTNGISLKVGFTTPDVSEALVKAEAMSKCNVKYVLADDSKFNSISPITFANLDSAVVITTVLDDRQYKKYTTILEVEKNDLHRDL